MDELQNVVVGDKVVEYYRGEAVAYSTVTRVTPTLVITANGTYRKKTGYASGNAYERRRIKQVPPGEAKEIVATILMKRARRKLADIVWADVPNETVSAVKILLNQHGINV